MDYLASFRPIIDTTGTVYQPVAKYLSFLLNPLTHNEFKLKDSFHAVSRIHNNLFSEGYTGLCHSMLLHFLPTFLYVKPSILFLTEYINGIYTT